MKKYVQMLLCLAGSFLLLGLVISGVAKLREVAARTQCANNLKQIAIAIHTYSDTYDTLPTGTIHNPRLEPQQRLSWIASVLPFLE